MLQALAGGAARRGECSARPWGGFGVAGIIVALGGTATFSLLFMQSALLQYFCSRNSHFLLPRVSPAPLRPSGCGVSPTEVGFAEAVGSRLNRLWENTQEGDRAGDSCVLIHLRALPGSAALCFSSTLVPIQRLTLPLGSSHSPSEPLARVSSAWLFLWVRVCHSLLSWALHEPWICFPNHVPI